MRLPKVRNGAGILTTINKLGLTWPSRGPTTCHLPRLRILNAGYVRLPATPTARQHIGLACVRFGMSKTPAKACRSFRSLALPGPRIGYRLFNSGSRYRTRTVFSSWIASFCCLGAPVTAECRNALTS